MRWGWRKYVPVAQRRAKAARYAQQLAKNGKQLQPVTVEGRNIAKTFWGKAWCDNLERYSDFANRLPRGRTYVRNGSVIDLQIAPGKIEAMVSGSEIYRVAIDIAPLSPAHWETIKTDCSQSVPSLIDLLQGRLSAGVMERLTRPQEGLFPQPREIKMKCSCPDWATLCKHVAAVLYGVGARLDEEPELLFQLRKVDHLELIASAVEGDNLEHALGGGQADTLAGEDLEAIFGIELEGATSSATAAAATSAGRKKSRAAPAKTSATKKTKSPVATKKKAAKKKSPVQATAKSAKKTAKASKPRKSG